MTFTVGHLFCGSGLGALGFEAARAELGGHFARFRTLGGVDVDPAGCADFERLTGVPALCADVHTLAPAELRAAWGERRPDAVFLSPPCKGFSRLISTARSGEDRYQRLNELVVEGIAVVLLAWPTPPPLLLLENVEGIRTRGAALLVRVRQLLLAHGYRLHEGIHDLGVVGGLAQHRRRFFLVARLEREVPGYVYQPPVQRVRACGEVLGPLPLPDDPAGGPMHRLPRVKLLTWVRLAMTRAGKDWRDLPRRGETMAAWWARLYDDERTGPWTTSTERNRPSATTSNSSPRERASTWAPTATSRSTASSTTSPTASRNVSSSAWRPSSSSDEQLPLGLTSPVGAGEEDRAHFPRHDVRSWADPARTVAGTGSNGGCAVADPRVAVGEERFGHSGRVAPWSEAAGTVTTSPSPSSGAITVADPRVLDAVAPGATGENAGAYKDRPHYLSVADWRSPTRTVTGKSSPSESSGVGAVVDERVALTHAREGRFSDQYRVQGWRAPAKTVTGATDVQEGAPLVSDPRPVPLTCRVRNGAYGVLGEREPAATVTGSACIDNGPVAIADSRARPPWPASYRLLSLDDALGMLQRGEELAPGVVPVIPSPHDGHWHRPLTTLELAVLQGMDWRMPDGAPLVLHGTSTAAWRERIGNGVPVAAARAAGSCHLRALLAAKLGHVDDVLAIDPVWVEEREQLSATEAA